jgi:hypothetical protein
VENYAVQRFFITSSSNANDFQNIIRFKADINVIFRGEFVPASVLNSLQGIKVAISTEPFPKVIDKKFDYTLDSIRRFKYFLTIFEKNFDYVFHYDQSSEFFLRGQGIELSGYFALPIAHQTYKPPLNFVPKWDICFIGRSTTHREEFLLPIKSQFKVIHIAHGICGTELLDYINYSKINLNLHAEPELSWEPRVQLLLACGALVISENISPNDHLIPGKHFLEVKNKDELLPLCDQVLQKYHHYDDIKKDGVRQVHKTLCSYTNFNLLIENILNKKYHRPIFNKNKIDLSALEICKEYNNCEYLLAQIITNYRT